MNFLTPSDQHRLEHLFPFGVGSAPLGDADAEVAELMASQGILPADLPDLKDDCPDIFTDNNPPQNTERRETDLGSVGATVVDLFTGKRK